MLLEWLHSLLTLFTPSRELHILSLPTLEPYPGVAKPVIFLPVELDSTVELDIYESHFAASAHPNLTYKYEGSAYVYNWRTGKMLTVRVDLLHSCELAIMTLFSKEIFYPCNDFFLLTEELVACYVTGRGPADHFAIFRVTDTGNVRPRAFSLPLCIFNLPHPTGDKNWYLRQGKTNRSYRGSPPPTDPSTPFYSSDKRQLLSLCLLPTRNARRNPFCSLIVPLRTFLDLVPTEPAPSTVTFDWDAWGPTGSRLLSGVEARRMSLQFGWKIAVFGHPDLPAPPGTSREVGITIYDFNPLPFHAPQEVTESGKKALQEPDPEIGKRLRRVVTSPSSCPNSVGLRGIQTSLPYRVTSAPFEICGRATDPIHYEISLGEDGMIVWTHVSSIADHHTLPKRYVG